MLQKLYVRIWLAVVLALAMLSLLVGLVWRMATEPPLRVVVAVSYTHLTLPTNREV